MSYNVRKPNHLIDAGELNKKVTLQHKNVTKNAFGEEIVTWSTIASVWASIQSIKDREYFESQQIQNELTTRIIIRYRTGLKPYDRVVYGKRIFEIVSQPININTANTQLHLMCRELM